MTNAFPIDDEHEKRAQTREKTHVNTRRTGHATRYRSTGRAN